MREAGLRSVGDVSSLPVPPELTELVTKIQPIEDLTVAVPEGIWRTVEMPIPDIPREISGHDFSKYVSGFFKQGSQWAFSKGPLTQTLLQHKAGTDEKSLLALFNVILKFMGEPSYEGKGGRGSDSMKQWFLISTHARPR